jgi:DNA-directed RNA polymerase specialized sigma24 family protein
VIVPDQPLNLRDTHPSFLHHLHTDPEGAWRHFYIFFRKIMEACPPRNLRLFHGQERKDAISRLLVHFCDDSFRVLRQYRDVGAPFAVWFMAVANRFLRDLKKRDPNFVEVSGEDGSDARAEPSRTTDPEAEAARRQGWETVHRCLGRMNQVCRLLLIGEIVHGYRPLELTLLMGLPRDRNRQVGDKLRECRESLKRMLLAEGFDPDTLK